MAQDKYVTSSCIANIQRNLGEYAIPRFEAFQTSIDDTDVSFPGFGTIGLLLGNQYGDAQGGVKKATGDCITALRGWVTSLETIEKNWKAAEEASTVKYS
ncbi:hypothetical protein [Streptosporangium sp. CA-115845]|uniref:hypothetical protein n=1 Tax=Streptosporangium sp. CA-115845 TaxID=3240071 RepID=UPI003D8BFF96